MYLARVGLFFIKLSRRLIVSNNVSSSVTWSTEKEEEKEDEADEDFLRDFWGLGAVHHFSHSALGGADVFSYPLFPTGIQIMSLKKDIPCDSESGNWPNDKTQKYHLQNHRFPQINTFQIQYFSNINFILFINICRIYIYFINICHIYIYFINIYHIYIYFTLIFTSFENTEYPYNYLKLLISDERQRNKEEKFLIMASKYSCV